MLLEYIARYYKLLWLVFAAIGIIKIFLSYSLNANLSGVNGVFYALFKWYGAEEQEMEEQQHRRTLMRIHNVITFVLYLILLIILIATLITVYMPVSA